MSLDRRDFIQLLSLSPFLLLRDRRGAWISDAVEHEFSGSHPNILILIFDTFSAQHASLYGYPRRTTPNLERFASQATVYHNFVSTGSFTNPGTASILTGTYPWTHRSTQIFSTVLENFKNRNLFALLKEHCYSFAFTHNLIVDALLHQFSQDVNQILDSRELCLYSPNWSQRMLQRDYEVAVWRERKFRWATSVSPTSLAYSLINTGYWKEKYEQLCDKYGASFPLGLPNQHEQIFRLEDAMNWLGRHLTDLPKPFLGYCHFSPPHDPYHPRADFVAAFDDGWSPDPKPPNEFTHHRTEEFLDQKRNQYDRFIAYADAEFGRLCEMLEAQGMMDDTIVVVTSDHGELFERGIWMHWTEALYDPVIRVPLLIRMPGQSRRQDIYRPTSSVDLLPSLLSSYGLPIPDWCEGRPLPGTIDNQSDEERRIYSFDAKSAPRHGKITQGTIAMISGSYKLIHYFGYDNLSSPYELYNLSRDPGERVDLYVDDGPAWIDRLRMELDNKLHEINQDRL